MEIIVEDVVTGDFPAEEEKEKNHQSANSLPLLHN